MSPLRFGIKPILSKAGFDVDVPDTVMRRRIWSGASLKPSVACTMDWMRAATPVTMGLAPEVPPKSSSYPVSLLNEVL